MPTQQEVIREMANKKLLNGEQKKVLYKLFESKINCAIEKVRTETREEREKLENAILAKGKNDPVIKKLLQKIKQAREDESKAEKDIRGLGFILGYHDELGVYSANKELEKFNQSHDKKLDKMDELKYKLLADIHGLPMSYDEMVSYIEKELAKIQA